MQDKNSILQKTENLSLFCTIHGRSFLPGRKAGEKKLLGIFA